MITPVFSSILSVLILYYLFVSSKTNAMSNQIWQVRLELGWRISDHCIISVSNVYEQ